MKGLIWMEFTIKNEKLIKGVDFTPAKSGYPSVNIWPNLATLSFLAAHHT